MLSVRTSLGRGEVGVVVDWVAVVDIQPRDIKAVPYLGTQPRDDFIQSSATIANRMVILLDGDELIRRDIRIVQAAALPGAA